MSRLFGVKHNHRRPQWVARLPHVSSHANLNFAHTQTRSVPVHISLDTRGSNTSSYLILGIVL